MRSTSVRIPKEVYDALKVVAKRRGMLISALLGRILERYLKEQTNG